MSIGEVDYDPATGEVTDVRDWPGRPVDSRLQEVTLILSLAQGASTWRITGDNPPSARVTFEIPSSEFASMMKLVAMNGLPLKATFRVDS
jgi:hypothetical protein